MTSPAGTVEPTTLLGALIRIRVATERHMDDRDTKDLGWVEETLTDLAIGDATPFVKPVQFNRTQEVTVGAGCLWWWLDSATGECFGALVQAKRLERSGTKWIVDVRRGLDSVGNDPDSTQSQYSKLLYAAKELESRRSTPSTPVNWSCGTVWDARTLGPPRTASHAPEELTRLVRRCRVVTF